MHCSDSCTQQRRHCMFLLFCSFIIGFLSGVNWAINGYVHYSSLLHSTHISSAALICLLGSAVCPILLSVLIAEAGKLFLFYPLSFLYALVYGMIVGGLFCDYGAAHWLVLILFFFTGTVNRVSLLWFWCRCISSQTVVRSDTILSIAVSASAAILDYLVISPVGITLFQLWKG